MRELLAAIAPFVEQHAQAFGDLAGHRVPLLQSGHDPGR